MLMLLALLGNGSEITRCSPYFAFGHLVSAAPCDIRPGHRSEHPRASRAIHVQRSGLYNYCLHRIINVTTTIISSSSSSELYASPSLL